MPPACQKRAMRDASSHHPFHPLRFDLPVSVLDLCSGFRYDAVMNPRLRAVLLAVLAVLSGAATDYLTGKADEAPECPPAPVSDAPDAGAR